MTTIVPRKPHRTMQLVERLMTRSKTRKFIHPAYRQLVLKKQRLVRRAKRRITPARKLLDRAIHHSPIPCVPPFLCPQCGMSSGDLDALLDHECGRKIGGLSEYANWQKIVSHGYRSKAKDALAVLETIPFPQLAKIVRPPWKNHEEAVDGPVTPVYNPKSLSDCAYAVLDKMQFCQPPDHIDTNGPQRISQRNVFVDGADATAPLRLGYYCHGCQRIFRPYFAFDDHLEGANPCNGFTEPLEIDITSHFPLNGRVIEPCFFKPDPKPKMQCTRCSQSDFKSRATFHEHLFECARNSDLDTDADADSLRTPSELSEVSS